MSLTVAQVDAAITQILTTGQSVTIDGVTYTRADLGALRLLRSEIQAEESSTSRGNILERGMFAVLGR